MNLLHQGRLTLPGDKGIGSNIPSLVSYSWLGTVSSNEWLIGNEIELPILCETMIGQNIWKKSSVPSISVPKSILSRW